MSWKKKSTVHGPLASCLGHGPYRYLGVGDPKMKNYLTTKKTKTKEWSFVWDRSPQNKWLLFVGLMGFLFHFLFFVATWATFDPKSHFRESCRWHRCYCCYRQWLTIASADAVILSASNFGVTAAEAQKPWARNDPKTRGIQDWVVVSNIFYVHPYLGKIPNLTNIFQMGWNHQLVMIFPWGFYCLLLLNLDFHLGNFDCRIPVFLFQKFSSRWGKRYILELPLTQ